MNKKANRRAFFVCVAVCLFYVSIAFNLPGKIQFRRISDEKKEISRQVETVGKEKEKENKTRGPKKTPKGGQLAVSQKEPPPQPRKGVPPRKTDEDHVEPSLFISIPLVCYAIGEGVVEKDGLMASGKDDTGPVAWKRPYDILKDRDEEGLKAISRAMGPGRIRAFFKREGITVAHDLSPEEIIIGRGYLVERKKLLELYSAHVPEDFNALFPFSQGGSGIVKRENSFHMVSMRAEARLFPTKEEPEWLMPNVKDLPVKKALEHLLPHTSNVRIIGSGNVLEQSPKAFERIKGEAVCVLHGRVSR